MLVFETARDLSQDILASPIKVPIQVCFRKAKGRRTSSSELLSSLDLDSRLESQRTPQNANGLMALATLADDFNLFLETVPAHHLPSHVHDVSLVVEPSHRRRARACREFFCKVPNVVFRRDETRATPCGF